MLVNVESAMERYQQWGSRATRHPE
jgi:hypothetical protein